MTDNLCRKRKLADSFIPFVIGLVTALKRNTLFSLKDNNVVFIDVKNSEFLR